MGCAGSTNNTAIRPLRKEELDGDEEEAGSKHGERGDSAVSKGTTDSGVVMENKEIPVLPGAVPRNLPPLTSECIKETLLQDCTVQERQKSSEILEELLSQGIILVGQTKQRSNTAGEAYNIMLEDRDVRRPPARLESLKAKNVRNVPSKEEIDKKIRIVEERRKLREEELKMRLRSKSARVRVRAPISHTEEDKDTSLTPVNPLLSPLTCHPTQGLSSHSQTAAKAGDYVREAGSIGWESKNEMGKAEMTKGNEWGGASGDSRGENAKWVSENGKKIKKEEEREQVEELLEGQLLTASEELESYSSFQHLEDKEETF